MTVFVLTSLPSTASAAGPADRLLRECYGKIPALPAYNSTVVGIGVDLVRKVSMLVKVEVSERDFRKAGRLVKALCNEKRPRNPRSTRRLQGIVRRFKNVIPNAFDFGVSGSSVVNAYMGPNGQGCVNEGLLERLTHDAAVAMVVGHEIGHSILEHSEDHLRFRFALQTLAKAAGEKNWSKVKNAMLWGGLDAYVPLVRLLWDDIVAVGAMSAAQLTSMVYDQDQEFESDRIGLCLMHKAGYDTSRASALFEALGGSGGSTRASGWDAFLSSHPVPPERVAYIKTLRDKLR